MREIINRAMRHMMQKGRPEGAALLGGPKKGRQLSLLLLLAGTLLLAGACDRNLPGTLPTMQVMIGDVPLTVEVADTLDTRTAGLKGRDSMPEDHGMLFAFPAPQMLAFYMKDTPLPLDIGYFDQQGFLIEYFSMKPDDGKSIYTSSEPALYAVETNQGWFDRNGISKYAQLQMPEPVRAKD
ncbi:MAG: DUF192 domain-containing protein [Leptospiraceae bacterium]|nr:DUF192 domain-containing protein [Leptospiraceae bacterium]